MRFVGRGTAVGGIALGLMGGFGFVQSRGGWSEVTQMPAKLDASTPEAQVGFQLLGVARSTADERSPRLPQGDASLGGTAGLVGSTRIWFQLPPIRPGERRVPRDDDLRATVTFSDGETYESRWEMADLDGRIATLMIPAGAPPCEWADVELRTPNGDVRWRLTRLPRTPRALSADASPRFEAEGVSIAAVARSGPRRLLNVGSEYDKALTGLLETRFRVSAPFPEGQTVRLRYDRCIPEYRHAADMEQSLLHDWWMMPGDPPRRLNLTFPYIDRLKAVEVQGHLEVLRVEQRKVEFPNAYWQASPGGPASLHSDPFRLPNRTQGSLASSFSRGSGPRIFGSLAVDQADPSSANGRLFDFRVSPDFNGWERKVEEAQRRGVEVRIPLGTVTGTLRQYTVIRTVPFRLVVPIGAMKPNDFAAVEKPYLRPTPGAMGRPRIATAEIGVRR